MKKAKRTSAGLIMYRITNEKLEVLLAHPGGPFFTKKDEGHWSIPKGEPDGKEELLKAAIREFEEETGIKPEGDFIELGSIVQKGGKEVFAWAFEGDLPNGFVHKCNTFKLEWPPKSGKIQEFKEIDNIEFFDVEAAKKKVKGTQIPLLGRLERHLG
ncbi:MAG TPA: NUDIX domain-containing protein [Ignavibacteria bacterium]|jgi:predicted NUDIX family NTP pyrophosphohydrolase